MKNKIKILTTMMVTLIFSNIATIAMEKNNDTLKLNLNKSINNEADADRKKIEQQTQNFIKMMEKVKNETNNSNKNTTENQNNYHTIIENNLKELKYLDQNQEIIGKEKEKKETKSEIIIEKNKLKENKKEMDQQPKNFIKMMEKVKNETNDLNKNTTENQNINDKISEYNLKKTKLRNLYCCNSLEGGLIEAKKEAEDALLELMETTIANLSYEKGTSPNYIFDNYLKEEYKKTIDNNGNIKHIISIIENETKKLLYKSILPEFKEFLKSKFNIFKIDNYYNNLGVKTISAIENFKKKNKNFLEYYKTIKNENLLTNIIENIENEIANQNIYMLKRYKNRLEIIFSNFNNIIEHSEKYFIDTEEKNYAKRINNESLKLIESLDENISKQQNFLDNINNTNNYNVLENIEKIVDLYKNIWQYIEKINNYLGSDLAYKIHHSLYQNGDTQKPKNENNKIKPKIEALFEDFLERVKISNQFFGVPSYCEQRNYNYIMKLYEEFEENYKKIIDPGFELLLSYIENEETTEKGIDNYLNKFSTMGIPQTERKKIIRKQIIEKIKNNILTKDRYKFNKMKNLEKTLDETLKNFENFSSTYEEEYAEPMSQSANSKSLENYMLKNSELKGKCEKMKEEIEYIKHYIKMLENRNNKIIEKENKIKK